jgi:cardiolipin synthase
MPDAGRLPPGPSSAVLTLPNVITVARLCAVPAAIYLVLHGMFPEAFWLFLGAGASDAVDGWLARRRGPTYVGAVLDPLADKALLMAMYVVLAVVHVLPDWLAILVVFRDVLIVGGVLVLNVLGQPPEIRPLMVSKVNTVLQIVLVAVALLMAGFGRHADVTLQVLIWVVAATTAVSGAAYVARAAQRPGGGRL